MAMRILITGGTGDVGRAAVERLVSGGHAVTVAGRRPGLSVPGAIYRTCDITDPAAVREAVRGAEAVVHLAAVPRPSLAPPEEVFRVNAGGTFQVFQAAAAEGIRRVVCASSINALGFNYGRRSFPILRLPIDEGHPPSTTDAYSFSKDITERIADYFWRREGISSVSLRLPWVAPAAFTGRGKAMEHMSACRASLDALLALPEAQRRERIEGWIAQYDLCRARGVLESDDPAILRQLPRDPLMGGRNNFWTLIDERDSALAIQAGLAASFEGSHAVFVNDDHNLTGLPSETLARLFFPEADRSALRGTESLVSVEAARSLIGFRPEHSVSRWFAGSGSAAPGKEHP